jgi:YVTN family beta-propeller protein
MQTLSLLRRCLPSLAACALLPSLAVSAQQESAAAQAPTLELPTGYAAAPGEDPGRIIVLNKAAHTASVVDVANGEILATLKTGVGPHEIAVHPDGRFAVVADYGEAQPGSSLTVLDLDELKVVGSIDLGAPIRPHGVVFEPSGDHLWVSAETQRQVWRVSFPAGEVDLKIDSDASATHMVAWAPDGRVFTANIGSGSTSVVGPRADGSYGLLAKVPTGGGAEGVCVTPNGKHVWVSNRADDSVSVIDATTLKVVKELPCAGFPIRAEATADGRMVLVSSATGGAVTLFDALDHSELARIAMPFQVGEEGDAILGQMGESSIPIGITLHPSGKLAFVANAAVDKIAVIDLVRRKVVAQLPTGRGPDGVAWVPTRRR